MDDTVYRTSLIPNGSLEKGEHRLYVIFSSTPFKMGRLIRFFTKAKYNHVSLSIDPALGEIYSFARRYRNTPFYGGFVRESGNRFRYGNQLSYVQICALPITEEQYCKAKAILKTMRSHSEEYVYNFFSALLYPLHRCVSLPNAYTCVEFVADIMTKIGVPALPDQVRFYSIKELERRLADRSVYCGICPLPFEKDGFEQHQNFFRAAALTAQSHAKLFKSFVKHKIF